MKSLERPETQNLGILGPCSQDVYGVLNEISQKVRISEFQIAWMGGVIIISSDSSKIMLNQADSGVSLGLIDVGISLIPRIDPSGLANEGAHEGAHVLFPSG